VFSWVYVVHFVKSHVFSLSCVVMSATAVFSWVYVVHFVKSHVFSLSCVVMSATISV